MAQCYFGRSYRDDEAMVPNQSSDREQNTLTPVDKGDRHLYPHFIHNECLFSTALTSVRQYTFCDAWLLSLPQTFFPRLVVGLL